MWPGGTPIKRGEGPDQGPVAARSPTRIRSRGDGGTPTRDVGGFGGNGDFGHSVASTAPASPARRSRCLHCDPPLTPASVLGRHPLLVVGLACAFVMLAIAAWVNDGWLLLQWDEPVQRFVEDARSGSLTAIVKRVSFLGSTVAVLSLGTALAIASWRRCRAVGMVVLAAMLARPLLEFTLKGVVGRDRPDFERLVDGTGHSFPSGHVMAAVALWGLVPLVVTLYTRNRHIWWASVIGSATLILAIGATRTYLGVHWLSDVVGGLIVGAFFLLGVEWLLTRQHRQYPCAAVHAARPAEE